MKQIVSTTQIIIFPGAVLLNAAIALFYRSFQVGQRLTVVFFKGIGPKKSSLPPLHVSSAENPQRLLHPCVTDISCAIIRCNIFKMSMRDQVSFCMQDIPCPIVQSQVNDLHV